MNYYCAACGRRIHGIHLIKPTGLRFHHACAELIPDEPTTTPEPKPKPDTTQTYRDIQSIISQWT